MLKITLEWSKEVGFSGHKLLLEIPSFVPVKTHRVVISTDSNESYSNEMEIDVDDKFIHSALTKDFLFFLKFGKIIPLSEVNAEENVSQEHSSSKIKGLTFNLSENDSNRFESTNDSTEERVLSTSSPRNSHRGTSLKNSNGEFLSATHFQSNVDLFIATRDDTKLKEDQSLVNNKEISKINRTFRKLSVGPIRKNPSKIRITRRSSPFNNDEKLGSLGRLPKRSNDDLDVMKQDPSSNKLENNRFLSKVLKKLDKTNWCISRQLSVNKLGNKLDEENKHSETISDEQVNKNSSGTDKIDFSKDVKNLGCFNRISMRRSLLPKNLPKPNLCFDRRAINGKFGDIEVCRYEENSPLGKITGNVSAYCDILQGSTSALEGPGQSDYFDKNEIKSNIADFKSSLALKNLKNTRKEEKEVYELKDTMSISKTGKFSNLLDTHSSTLNFDERYELKNAYTVGYRCYDIKKIEKYDQNGAYNEGQHQDFYADYDEDEEYAEKKKKKKRKNSKRDEGYSKSKSSKHKKKESSSKSKRKHKTEDSIGTGDNKENDAEEKPRKKSGKNGSKSTGTIDDSYDNSETSCGRSSKGLSNAKESKKKHKSKRKSRMSSAKSTVYDESDRKSEKMNGEDTADGNENNISDKSKKRRKGSSKSKGSVSENKREHISNKKNHNLTKDEVTVNIDNEDISKKEHKKKNRKDIKEENSKYDTIKTEERKSYRKDDSSSESKSRQDDEKHNKGPYEPIEPSSSRRERKIRGRSRSDREKIHRNNEDHSQTTVQSELKSSDKQVKEKKSSNDDFEIVLERKPGKKLKSWEEFRLLMKKRPRVINGTKFTKHIKKTKRGVRIVEHIHDGQFSEEESCEIVEEIVEISAKESDVKELEISNGEEEVHNDKKHRKHRKKDKKHKTRDKENKRDKKRGKVKKLQQKEVDSFVPNESGRFIQIDGHSFFVDNRICIVVQSVFANEYAKFTFTCEIDKPFLNEYFLRKFTPCFVNIVSVENLNKEKQFVYCNKKPLLVQSNNRIEAVYVISPRYSETIDFEICDCATSNFIGSGIVEQHQGSINSLGTKQFVLLPQRKRKLNIYDKIILSVETLDPSYSLKPINCVTKFKKVRNIESIDSRYFRFIIYSGSNKVGASYMRKLMASLSKISGFSLYSTKTKRAISQNSDNYTGFHLQTPDEDIIILEARATPPSGKANLLFEILEKDVPPSVQIIKDRETTFPAPRLYQECTYLVTNIKSPINVLEMTRLNDLYFRGSNTSKLFTIVQRLADIHAVASVRDAISFNIYPNGREINLLAASKQDLCTIPTAPYLAHISELHLDQTKELINEVQLPEESRSLYKRLYYRMPKRVLKLPESSDIINTYLLFKQKFLDDDTCSPTTPSKIHVREPESTSERNPRFSRTK